MVLDVPLLVSLAITAGLGLGALVLAIRRPRGGRPALATIMLFAVASFGVLIARALHLSPCTPTHPQPATDQVDSLMDRIAPGLRLASRVCDAEARLRRAEPERGSSALHFGLLTGYLGLQEGRAWDMAGGASPLLPHARTRLTGFAFSGQGSITAARDSLTGRLGPATREECRDIGTWGISRTMVWDLPGARVTLTGDPDQSGRSDSLGRIPPAHSLVLAIARQVDRAFDGPRLVPCPPETS